MSEDHINAHNAAEEAAYRYALRQARRDIDARYGADYTVPPDREEYVNLAASYYGKALASISTMAEDMLDRAAATWQPGETKRTWADCLAESARLHVEVWDQ